MFPIFVEFIGRSGRVVIDIQKIDAIESRDEGDKTAIYVGGSDEAFIISESTDEVLNRVKQGLNLARLAL